ncbi:MAG TPA: hypothetical protein VJZ27_06605 [Aggregatilineales bacterium]|nr:hypothetical protein [Aggregatilineales bacterium]
MLSLDTSIRLKKAGLEWKPSDHDFFFIPYQELDEHVYVISEMTVVVERMGGKDAIMFNGASEWALDYLVLTEAVWRPSESQLRECLEKKLVERSEEQPVLTLSTTHDGYACEIRFAGENLRFETFSADEAYGNALLHVLENN